LTYVDLEYEINISVGILNW